MNRNEIALKFTLVLLGKCGYKRITLTNRIKRFLAMRHAGTYVAPWNESIKYGFEAADDFILKSKEDDAYNAVITDSDYLTNK